MRKLILFLLICISAKVNAQVYQEMPQYGYRTNRMAFDSTLQIPTTCGVPTLKSIVKSNKNGAIAYDSCNAKFYAYNPKTLTWSEVSGGGGGPTDTTSLSNRINTKIDSIKRSNDSIYARKNGNFIFQFKDSVGSNDTSKVVIAQVHNATATTLLRGEVVYLFGANGSVASVKRANNKQDSTSSKTFGLVRADIPSGSTGYVTTQGQIEKLNLGSPYNEGDVLWLDSLDGQFTKVKPQAPFHGVFLGIVERANNGNGLAYIKPQNGVELDEVHDVQLNSILNNQIIVYSDTQKVWKNRSIYSLVDTASKIATKTNLTNYVDLTTNQTIAGQKTFSTTIKLPTTGSNLILQMLSDGSIATMSSATYPTPTELAYVKGTTSNIQTQFGNKLTISDTTSMLSPYLRTNIANVNFLSKVNVNDTATMLSKYLRKTDTTSMLSPYLRKIDTASLSYRISLEQSNLDLLQLMGYTIKAEPYGVTLAQMTGQLGLTTNQLCFYPFYWNVSDSIRGVSWFNRAASTSNQTNYNGLGIYSLSGGTLTRLTFTANDTTFWDCTANSWSNKSLTPYYLTKGLYFIGYQFSGTGGTPPTIGSGDPLIIAGTESPAFPPAVVNPNGIRFSTFISNATTTPPSSVAMSTTTFRVGIPYFLFY